MRYISRLITQKLLHFLQFFPSVVVVGARQVGKSTLLKELLSKTFKMRANNKFEDLK